MSKASMGAGLDPRVLLVVRLAGATILVFGVLSLWRPAALRLRRPAWGATAALGAVIACLQLAYFLAVTSTNVGTAVFLEFLGPVLLVGIAWISGSLAFERWSVAAATVAVGGSLLLVVSGSGLVLPPRALAFGLMAAALLASQNLLMDRALRVADRLPVLAWSTVAGTATSLVIGLPGQVASTRWTGPMLLGAAYMIVLATLVPGLLLMVAVRRLGPARAGLVGTLEPVVAAASAALILNERMTAWQCVGGGMILLAILLIRQTEPTSSLFTDTVNST